MSTIKSSAENLTLNADGANNDIKFQSNGSEVASIDQAGLVTATTFAGSAASLTNVPAANITGTLPAIDGSNLTGISGGLVLVGSSVNMDSGGTTYASINIDQCFSSTYQNYLVTGTFGVEANCSVRTQLRSGSAGSESTYTAAKYNWVGYDWENVNGTLSANAQAEESNDEVSIAKDTTPHISDGNFFNMFIYSPYVSASDTIIDYHGVTYDAQNDIRKRMLGVNVRDIGQATGIHFSTNNGNLDEHAIRVYGIIDS